MHVLPTLESISPAIVVVHHSVNHHRYLSSVSKTQLPIHATPSMLGCKGPLLEEDHRQVGPEHVG